ncbi:MAG TPA: hypothetical protein VK563_13020 [Puia sp.]|nr:hypothetical protein [Puia sp.]
MLTILLVTAFFASPQPSASPKDSTGIKGYVYSVSGNQMPSPSRKPSSHHGTGIRSVLYIFRLTNTGQVVRQGQSPWYTAVNTALVRVADTDDKGYFNVLLPPGRYSVFTKKGDLFYASRMDEKNNIAPVEVLPGKMTELECRVESDHKPVY